MAHEVKGVIAQSERASVSFLLIHGFGASSDELSTLQNQLSDHGYSSFATQLAGHGTTPEDFRDSTWRDWYESAKSGLDLVRSWNTKYIIIAGFSMGGLLAALLAAEQKRIDGLVLIAPAIKIPGTLFKLIPFMKLIMKWREIDVEAAQRMYDIKRFKLAREPVSAYHELSKLQKVVKKNLQNIEIPTLILQGTDDKTVDPGGAKIILDGISSKIKELQFIPGAEHVISCHPTRALAYPHILRFIEQVTD